MKFLAKRINAVLVPAFDSDLTLLKKLSNNEVYEVEIKLKRNYEFHKKFFALLNIGFDNTKTGIEDFDMYRYYMTMKAGYYIEVKTPGGVMYIPQSIQFNKMDNSIFEKLYNAVLQQIILDTGAEPEDINNEIYNFL
jgi:hypothetical protein